MRGLSRLIVLLAAIVFAVNIACFGQVAGKLFTSAVADQKYGPVLNSVEFPTKNLTELLNETDKYIMFKIVNNSIVILDKDRKVLYPEVEKITEEDVFTEYSKSVVEDLISVGDADTVFFEQRKEVFTVTVGNVTMEIGIICPPLCQDQ